MRLWVVPVLALLATGCGKEEMTPAQRAAQDAKDIAAVKAASTPPPVPVSPQAILYPDIEKAGIYGASCSFAPDKELGAVAIAMDDYGYMKIDDKMMIFAADKGSGKLPGVAWGRYDGREYNFMIDVAKGEGEKTGGETVNYPARMVLKNSRDQVVYEANGTAQCGA
ncbi:hypothetical protein EB810_09615 [Altererythrobacter sp. FM1]|uniref:hypothetical protein n=1 Tax=Tsuneonella flava TaxID=2055955 RepID=UPI000C80E744|nr:hypothetical protein [Tsuneonella flava]ROT95342.1 hypothetical protein EB810_09615 [Altererythrobacter sp. FM1]